MDDILPSGNFLEPATFGAVDGAVASTIVVFGNPYGGSRASLNEQFDSWSTWVGIDDAFQWQTVDQVADAGTRDLTQRDKDGDGILDNWEQFLTTGEFCGPLIAGYESCAIVVVGNPQTHASVDLPNGWQLRVFGDGQNLLFIDGKFVTYVKISVDASANTAGTVGVEGAMRQGIGASASYRGENGIVYHIDFIPPPYQR